MKIQNSQKNIHYIRSNHRHGINQQIRKSNEFENLFFQYFLNLYLKKNTFFKITYRTTITVPKEDSAPEKFFRNTLLMTKLSQYLPIKDKIYRAFF